MSKHVPMFEAADQLIMTLHQHGHAAYRVGGCVRDQLLQRPISDIDIATSATPDEVIAIFDRTVPTGIQHGTVLVFEGEYAFEVTTFRTESGYVDFRRPSEVQFVTRIEDDLARRDFTINAMAQLPDGTIIDPFQGQADLVNRVIRCVGDARVRFEEDALRMLRAIRFAAQLNFTMDEATLAALVEQRPLLRHIAMERVGQEVLKVMDCAHVYAGLKWLEQTSILQFTKHQLHLDESFFASRLADLAQIGTLPAGPIRWASLFIHLQYGARDASKLLMALKLPSTLQQDVVALLTMHQMVQQTGDSRQLWVKAVLATSRETGESYLCLLNEESRLIYANWLNQIGATTVAELQVSGNQLIAIGIRRGPEMGRILNHLLEQVALGELLNEQDELLRVAKQQGEQE